jgi:phosphoenolpyruvate carboxylase
MTNLEKRELFRQEISNKYRIYNSLFLNLPNEDVSFTGIYIPLLHKLSKEGFSESKAPKEIINDFFQNHTKFSSEKQRFDFLFRVVQYIERQVVLFDCIEDATFSNFQRTGLRRFLNPKVAEYTPLKEHLKNFSTRLVFTAHPTQFYANEIQIIMYELRKAIKANDATKIDDLLQQLAYTPFVNQKKPTPFDEATSIIYYLRYVYYHTIGQLYNEIRHKINEEPEFNPSLVELGFWPGGDRDGNPFVTAETTFKVALLLRNTIMKCYYNHVKELRKTLTYKEVVPLLKSLKLKLYQQIFQDEVVINIEEILDYCNQIKSILIEKYRGIHLDELNDFIGRVHLFGSHFATLDIRQDSSKHREAIIEIFKKEFSIDYNNLDDDTKLKYLTQKSLNLDPNNYEDPIISDTIKNIKQISLIQKMNGSRGLHRYIISNSESIFDVLHVYALFLYCGYKPEEINIDVVPLFETMQGMHDSKEVMQALYKNDIYQRHLAKRGNEQTIMLGFSDGTKDGGYLKANLEIYKTKETLAQLAKDNHIKVVFFDGRGGPPARGGGKTHQFYAAQSNLVTGDKIQLTIQGQTITSIYGTHEQAKYNIEQLILAGAKGIRKEVNYSDEQRKILSDLSEKSYQKYIALKEHPLFVPYLEKMTTLKYYGETNIGSRPTKRNQSDKLTLRDLRAIPFVGSWSLVRQNVPGYYGLGTALETYKDNPEIIERLYKENAFFRSLVQNSMVSMKKSYFPLTAYMKNDPEFGDFWREIRSEYDLSKKWILKLTGVNELLDNEVHSRMSISARENIILPLLTIQQYALQMIQEEHEAKATFEKLVIRSLFGNINASRNSA